MKILDDELNGRVQITWPTVYITLSSVRCVECMAKMVDT